MKKLIILFILVNMLIFPATALAQTSQTEAGLTPDSLFYWFDRLAERIVLIFTLDPQDKVNALSKMGLERLAEAEESEAKATIGSLLSEYLTNQKEIEQNTNGDLESLLNLSEDQIEALGHLSIVAADNEGEVKNNASTVISYVVEKLKEKRLALSQMNIAGDPQALSRALAVLDKIANKLADPTAIPTIETAGNEKAGKVKEATSKHTAVLENNKEKVSEQAIPAIEKAIDKSKTGSEKATGAVSKPAPSSPPTPAAPSAPAEKGKKK